MDPSTTELAQPALYFGTADMELSRATNSTGAAAQETCLRTDEEGCQEACIAQGRMSWPSPGGGGGGSVGR
jgi:hypothetical protein